MFYLYYQPLVPAVAMLWAWAAAVAMFEARAIKYDVCFSAADQQRLLPASALYQVSCMACCVTAVLAMLGTAGVHLQASASRRLPAPVCMQIRTLISVLTSRWWMSWLVVRTNVPL